MTDDSVKQLRDMTWIRIIAVCIIWMTISCFILMRHDIIDIHSSAAGICIGIAIIAASILAINRTTYLPFLGRTVFPPSLLKRETSNEDANIEIDVRVSEHATHVAYWAAETSSTNPGKAYGKFQNSGIAKVDGTGMATMRITCPGKYYVRGRKLPRHVHYREVFPSGLLGPVKKADIICA